MQIMTINTKLYIYFFCLFFVLFLGCSKPFAAMVIKADATHSGIISLKLPFFEDRSGSRSVQQAQSQFQRMKQSNALNKETLFDFGLKGGTYWIELVISNETQLGSWWFELAPHKANKVSPIKSIAIFDTDPAANTLAVWPAPGNNPRMTAVPVTLKPGETKRYIMVETWPGVGTPVVPILKSQEFVNDMTVDMSRKISFLWLMIGAAFGTSLVQLVLTHQPLQGMLALNALLVGLGIFAFQRSDLIPGLTDYHPVYLPLIIACVYGASASLILWATSRRYGGRSLMCLMPFVLNVVLCIVSLFYLNSFISINIGTEYLPLYLLTVTGLILMGMTTTLGLSDMNFFWLMPAWLALTALPWLNEYYPFAATIIYLIFLAIVGIASVFWYWKSMDLETESLQTRLRQELRNSKNKHQEENNNWNKKMETQRVLLNELRQREQQRSAELEIARQEADAANKAKSDFLAIISHEIRTPMNGIIGIVQMISQTSLDEKQSEYIDVIKNSGETMVTLLNDILDYSKIEKGVIDLEQIPFSLRKLAQSVVMLMSGRAEEKGINVTISITDSLPDMFSGDPNRIRQILLNLIGNAIKFTSKGSVTLNITGTKNRIRFEVIDTGIGIKKDAQDKLFQAYVQADASISRRYGGTGLGLNICRMLVDAMRGEIGVTSIENQGSTFWFEIPLTVSDTATAEMIKPSSHPADSIINRSILVIDDNAVNLRIVSSFLGADGHRVKTAESGQKALHLIQHETFDLIFVDIIMPDMGGEEFLMKLRQHEDREKAKIPVIALTGMADEASLAQFTANGMADVVTKPVNPKALREAISRITPRNTGSIELEHIMADINQLTDAQKEQLRKSLFEMSEAQPADVKPPEPPSLNMDMLSELKASLPPETLEEIFVELIDKAKELTDEIDQANAAKDYTLLGNKAHNIRGMAGNFGLQGLMEHSAAIENAVRDGDHEKAVILAKDSRRILDQSLESLDQWMKS